MATNNELNPWVLVKVPRNVVFRMAGLGWHPRDNFEEIVADVDRLIKAVIHGHTDESNVNMQADELYSELQMKVASILCRRDVFFPTREKFFGFLKVALQRHLRSHTQKFIYTYKRTGPKIVDGSDARPTKPVNICLDDDELGATSYVGGVDESYEEAHLREDLEEFIQTHLTEVEARVLRQEYEPNAVALDLTFRASQLHSRKFRVLDRHKAQGIGLHLHIYKRTLMRIRAKLKKFWES